jgi:hypothetical protein
MHACLYKFEGYILYIYIYIYTKKKKGIGFSNGKIREMCIDVQVSLVWICLFIHETKKRCCLTPDVGPTRIQSRGGESLMLLGPCRKQKAKN